MGDAPQRGPSATRRSIEAARAEACTARRPLQFGDRSSAGVDVGSEREAKLIASAELASPISTGSSPACPWPARRAPPRRHLLRHRGTRLGPLGDHASSPLGRERAAVDAEAARRAAGSALVRRELSFEGPPGTVPAAARDLVRAYVRSRPLIPVARLHTDRSPIEVRDASGRRLAEIVDDHVTVYQGQPAVDEFREIEVEVLAPGRVADRLLAAAIDRLVAAGCRADPPMPKLVRALGRRALEPPELTVPPVDPTPRSASWSDTPSPVR